jgi:hypothetical protein
MQPAILVTGAPRSSTTFVGKMLCWPQHMAFLDEPFNYQTGLVGVERPLVYLSEETPGLNPRYLGLMRDLTQNQAHFRPSALPNRDEHPIKQAGRRLFRSRTELKYQLDSFNPLRTRYLIKDPMACFASGYLHQSLGLSTLIIIRHPASTIASYKRLGWHYQLSDLTSQPALMERYLEPILGRLDLGSLSPVQTWAYFWLSIYMVLDDYIQKYPNIYDITHEQLSREPQEEFASLYRHCGLPWSDRVARKIDRYTDDRNPAAPKAGDAHSLKRNSAANIHRWKKMLDPDEIAEIRRITEPLASKYYSDSDW